MNNDFNIEKVTRLSLIVNTSLLLFVAFMMLFFVHYGVVPMIVYSSFALAGYALYYIILAKRKVCIYMWCVYATIVLYMAVATISLGYEYGFNLYSMSIIPIIIYSRYMAKKLKTQDTHPVVVSVLIVAVSLISSAIAIINGPLYIINKTMAAVILACNSLSVAAFLIYYTNMIVNLVIASEDKLGVRANYDQLTELHSRRYMIDYLKNNEISMKPQYWIAMLDVDDFKKINDTYGHNCGDYVLHNIAMIMKRVCNGCQVSRWGGEEFLIHSSHKENSTQILEELRKAVEQNEFIYKQQKIRVTVTIGGACYKECADIEELIKRADDNLYLGKNNGKNQVITDKENI